ncbi:MAG: glycosyl hydrolase [Anaerolineales bacterium]|nr:glycosyl hydrolase [Anaerolineales bacterium]
MSDSARRNGGIVLIAAGLVLIAIFFVAENAKPAPTPTPIVRATSTPEPLIPTRTRALQETRAIATPTRVISSTPLVPHPSPRALFWQGKPRWGIGVAIGPISRYDISAMSFGWYLDWRAIIDPPKPGNIEYAQMVRLITGDLQPREAEIAQIARANPGSLWLIGNEPDVKWQDNVEPSAYARLYQRAYRAIKDADPTAQVAIGGVTQPTPLRLRYLDQVLAAYREQNQSEMPVDVWNVHNFILREERGSWGVDIPPGLSDATGMLYEVDDSGNLDLFRQQIVAFRQWMAARGFQNYPLIVSEYGIPMPEDYGFPNERVLGFIADTFDFFLIARDPALGYPADDYKLVQRWCWYSLNDTGYPTGRLFDPQTGEMTDIGKGLGASVRALSAP